MKNYFPPIQLGCPTDVNVSNKSHPETQEYETLLSTQWAKEG